MHPLRILLTLLALAATGFSELKLATLFSDGMVLQRDQPLPVWGWTTPGETVEVSFAGQTQSTTAGPNGKFLVHLPAQPASAEPATLCVRTAANSTVQIHNVLVGEVWLCSGQSNMFVPVANAMNFSAEQAAATLPQLRMFLTDKKASVNRQDDCGGSWQVCSPDTVGRFSATAYFFGRELHRDLDVPIGLIRSCWGGTCIEAWSPLASLKKFPTVRAYQAAFDARVDAFENNPAWCQAEALKQWKDDVIQAEGEGKRPPKKPTRPTHPHADQNYPANLYNAMIHPLVPYGIRGAIWYQGERNAKTAAGAQLYRDLLENLVVQWRNAWNRDLPFYAVQLVNYRKPQQAPVEDSAWAFIRESFLKFHKEVPNVGIAVGIDVGDSNSIHPKNKQAIGYRLAQQALKKTYGKKIVAGGPIYRSMKTDGNKIVLQFDNLGSGLIEHDGQPLKTFAIAGADRQFVRAQAAIVGDTLVVSATSVAAPVAVRYAWADNPVGCNLFNKEGFPASPFRTDEWPSTGD